MDEQNATENQVQNQIESQTGDLPKDQTEHSSENHTKNLIKKQTANQIGKPRETIWKRINKFSESVLAVTLIATIIGGLVAFYFPKLVTYIRCQNKPYVTFEADYMQVLQLSEKVETLEYSIGGRKWKELGKQNIVFGGNRGKLLLRGKNKKGTVIHEGLRRSSIKAASISFATDAEVICSGDIRTLVDYKHYDKAETSEAKFIKLFSGCKQLVVAPDLPAMDLADNCYYSMFSGCSSLKTAPELPAKKLASSCYSFMFTNCTSLMRAPELPAEKLANSCYTYMFSGCTSLGIAPKLSADTLSDFCYSGMFTGCISLYAPITLPAVHLAKCCYQDMLSGCSSITQITMLAKEVVDNQCIRLLDGVSPSGVFYKNRNATWSNDGIVPEGWTVSLINY